MLAAVDLDAPEADPAILDPAMEADKLEAADAALEE